MVRNLSNHSESMIRDRGGSHGGRSPSRKSPSLRERSPVWHRSSHKGSSPAREKERHSSHAKSTKHAQSQSPVSRSPSPRTRRLARDEREVGKVTERDHERNHSKRSDKRTHMEKRSSPSPLSQRSSRAREERDAEKVTERDHGGNNGRGNDKGQHEEILHAPISRSPSPRTKRLRRTQAERGADKWIEKEHERSHSRTIDKEAHSPISRSPSPRTKRLRRAEAKVRDRDREKNHGRASDKDTHRERGLERETGIERNDRGNDKGQHGGNNDRGNDKGQHEEILQSPISRSPSPRTKRLRRTQAERDADKRIEKEHERSHSRTIDKEAHSPISRSPSPRTKRLRRAEAKVKDRDREKNHGRASDKDTHRERGLERETGIERKERRDMDTEGDRKDRKLGRDEANNKSSRSRHDQSTSPLDRPHWRRHGSRSPQPSDGARTRREVTNSREAEHRNDDGDSVAQMKAAEEALQAKEKQKPSFELSGKLAAETNRFRGVTLLFSEPPDARKPNIRWRLYVFKGGEVLNEPLYIHRQSFYLFGRERRVADIPTDHPSCSKQHAVIQFRQVEKEQPDGMLSKEVRPYLMDLGSTNKTYLNENPIDPQRYYELFEKDTIKFGNSSREYVLLHENSID